MAQKLQIDQADADKNIAQAKAEERHAMAIAIEQEMLAKAQEMARRLSKRKLKFLKALAEAFRGGNLGVMDYYRLQNIQADTSMRNSISEPPKGDK